MEHLVETVRHDVQTTCMDISVQKDVTAKNINIVIMCMDVKVYYLLNQFK